jgi:hypothetical protein
LASTTDDFSTAKVSPMTYGGDGVDFFHIVKNRSAVLYDQVSAIKELSRENSLWRLQTPAARSIAALLQADDVPLVVLPMRDVWINATKFPGIRAAVCLSRQKLVALSKPLFTTNCVSWSNADIASLSPYDNRTFEVSYRDGITVKMRGMIGERKVDEMTLSLYSAIESLVSRSA